MFCVIFSFCFFFLGGGGLRVRWGGPKPSFIYCSLFWVLFVLLFVLLFVFFFFLFGGFKGPVRWPEGSPRLALNPLYFGGFILFCFLFVFFALVFLLLVFRKQDVFSLKKKRVFLLIFQCLPLFLPSLSHFPFSLYMYIYIYISLSFSLSLYLFFLSLSLSRSFLGVFIPGLLSFFSFSKLCFLSCSFAFVSCKEQHQNITL